MKTTPIVAAIVLFTTVAWTQESDLELKQNFENKHRFISGQIDSARTVSQLDSLKEGIRALQTEYAADSSFLDKALYPETFATRVRSLRTQYAIARERVTLIGTQGVRIVQLEAQLVLLSRRLDSLEAQGKTLAAELKSSRQSVTQLRDLVKRLTTTMQAKDRLIFSLIDSIFLPYDRNLNLLSEIQREALTSKLERSNVVKRVYDIAMDNVSFLGLTQLQPKDYAALVEEYQQFANRWNGLREKIKAAEVSVETKPPVTTKGGAAGPTGSVRITTTSAAGEVDTALAVWERKLQGAFWVGLEKEFSGRGVTMRPFTDAKGFAASVRAYVDSAKATGADASTFVNDVWVGRVDKDWREALMKESMLGKTEYAALDKSVSELRKEKLDWRVLFWIGNIILLVLIGWWVLSRKPKRKAVSDTQVAPPPEKK